MTDDDIPSIEAVKAEPNATLLVTWKEGGESRVDLNGWIATGRDILKRLLDPAFFATARIEDYGGIVQWGEEDDDIVIDSYHLRLIADEQRPFGAADLAAWQAKARLSNIEAAGLLGVAPSTYSKWKAGGCSIPETVGMICRASLRDSVIISAHLRPTKPVGRPRKTAAA